jgi:hypothetical protein
VIAVDKGRFAPAFLPFFCYIQRSESRRGRARGSLAPIKYIWTFLVINYFAYIYFITNTDNMKTFMILMLFRDDWNDPNVWFFEAKNKEDALNDFYSGAGYTEDEVEEQEEEGYMHMIVKEVK